MYHILVKMKDNINYFEYNIEKTEEEVIKDYIIPYIDGIDFFLESGYVNRKNIREIVVKNMDEKIEKIRDYLQDKVAKNVFYFYTNDIALENNICGKNIVSDLIKKSELLRIKEKKSEKKSEIIPQNNKIFIVHGHDDGMKTEVARFVEQIGLKPIVLHEQASKGKTIIEKIDEYTNVRYGIVLYSPCDKGKSNKEEVYKDRARQNVVFEHGYLIGKLGKDNVTALNKGNIETPSDIGGVIYIAFDNHEGWKMKIVKELKANGFEIDLNKLF